MGLLRPQSGGYDDDRQTPGSRLCNREDRAMKKSEVLDLLRDMPEELDIERLIYLLYVRRKIELAVAAADAGEVISHEELVQQSEEWRD